LEIVLTDTALDHLEWWRTSGNKKAQKKITALLKEIQTNPLECTGKPEALKYSLVGTFSRRINSEHRIRYEVIENLITVLSLKGHYE
jgi:toxin YoeB